MNSELKIQNKKIINAWAFYDWANSVYPLVITTAVFPIYYAALTSTKTDTGEVFDTVLFFGFSFKNTELMSYVISFSYVIVAFISPLLSGVADYAGNKKVFLKLFCYIGAIACASLYFFDADYLEWSMISVVLASVGYWASIVFYNSYLPEIAAPKYHDQISAKGYSLGYFGSALLLIICLGIILGVGDAYTPYCFLLVGLWWIGFSQITYARLPDGTRISKFEKSYLTKGFKELQKVWKELKNNTLLKSYLLAFFVFSMAVQTVMIMAVYFAEKEILWPSKSEATSGLIISILIIQFIAIPGSYCHSWLSKKLGNVKALMVSLFLWVILCVSAWFISLPIHFYFIAGFVGFVMGGVQSLSRSTYSKFLPSTTIDHASYFSFYDVCEKIGLVIGAFSFGFIEGITGSMRNSILAWGTYFVVGLLLLWRVKSIEREKV